MGRKRSYGHYRNRKGFVAIPFEVTLALSTLANGIVASTGVLANFGEDIFIMSMKASWTLRGATPNEGPLALGYAHGDLSNTEIAEALTAELTDPDDIIQREKARRPVRRVGSFPVISANEALNNGNDVKTLIKFSVGDGHDLSLWVQNLTGATLTTGAVVNLVGVLFGRWQR